MTEPVVPDVPAYARELARANLEAVREALCRFVEASRQTHDLLSRSADLAASGALALHDLFLRHAAEHLQLSLELTQRLAEAKRLDEALEAQGRHAQLSAEFCVRQVEELSRFSAQFAPKGSPETDPDLL